MLALTSNISNWRNSTHSPWMDLEVGLFILGNVCELATCQNRTGGLSSNQQPCHFSATQQHCSKLNACFFSFFFFTSLYHVVFAVSSLWAALLKRIHVLHCYQVPSYRCSRNPVWCSGMVLTRTSPLGRRSIPSLPSYPRFGLHHGGSHQQ